MHPSAAMERVYYRDGTSYIFIENADNTIDNELQVDTIGNIDMLLGEKSSRRRQNSVNAFDQNL